jgi:hypothetical protein
MENALARKADQQLARAWTVVQTNWWAYEAIADACEKHPKRAWRLLEAVLRHANTRELVRDVGCGPLEDFVRLHAPHFIRQIENRARDNIRFARALSHVNLPGARDDISRRLFALGCKPCPFKLDRWQTK